MSTRHCFIRIVVICVYLLLGIAQPILADVPPSSPSFIQDSSLFNAGGGVSQSASYSNQSVVGDVQPDTPMQSPSYSNQGSFLDEEPEDTTAIELVSFGAESVGNTVHLTWITGTERDTAGFHLVRSRVEAGGYERVTGAIIPAEGDEFTGASYEFIDDTVDEGTWYYKLEAVDLTGTSEFFGPVDVTAEAEPEFGCGMADSGAGAGVLAVMAAIGMLIWSRRRLT